MKHSLKVGALVLAAVAWLLISQSLYAASYTDHVSPAVETAGICLSSTWMPRVTITRPALAEIRDRMSRYDHPTGICITGPFEEDCRAPQSIEEAWLIEKLYGPPPRWVLEIVPLKDLTTPPIDPGEMFYVDRVFGISVGIHTTKTVSRLSVELFRDSIRVYEIDA